MPSEPLYNDVVDTVARKIVSGVIPAGDVLSLASLQEDFSISRTVAREVMRMLESVGLVTSQRSVGLIVLPQTSWAVLDTRVIEWRLAGAGRESQLRSLIELRAAVEPVAAAAAARKATSEQRAELLEHAALLSSLGSADAQHDEFTETDIKFHTLLLTASGNELFTALRDVLAVTLTGRLRHGLMPKHARPEALSAHLEVASAVSEADTARAFETMVEMMAGIRAELFID